MLYLRWEQHCRSFQVRGRMESSSSSVAGLRGGNPRDAHETEEYAGVEGKNMDKLWRWTAVVTAAKMGVSGR